jgi:hypothetical protein
MALSARGRTVVSTILLALLAAASIWSTLREERRGEAAQAAAEAEARVFSFEANEVRELAVRAKGDVTRVVRAGEGWRLTSPVEAEADALVVNGIAEALATLRRLRGAAPAGGDARPFGLAPPAATIEVVLEGGRRETLAIGDQSTFDGSIFVQPTSGAVVVVPGEARYRLERTTEDPKAKPKPAEPPGPGQAGAGGNPVDPKSPSP